MSTKGKRVIYAGPIGHGDNKPLTVEGVALSAIAPGTVIEDNATGLDVNAIAATVFGQQLMVADKDSNRQKTVDDNWVINENMIGILPRSGEFINILVATGQTLAVGSALSRNGAGLLKLALTGGTEEIVAYSDEAITTSGTTLVRVRVA